MPRKLPGRSKLLREKKNKKLTKKEKKEKENTNTDIQLDISDEEQDNDRNILPQVQGGQGQPDEPQVPIIYQAQEGKGHHDEPELVTLDQDSNLLEVPISTSKEKKKEIGKRNLLAIPNTAAANLGSGVVSNLKCLSLSEARTLKINNLIIK